MNNKKTAIICSLSGILSALPFIFENLYILIFLTLSPTFYCIINDVKKSFSYAMCHLFAFYFFSDIWFLSIGTNFFNLKIPGFIISFILLILISLILSFSASLPFSLLKYISASKTFIISASISMIYIFGEWLHGIYPINFPWNRLCNVLTADSSLIQSASLFGGLFLSLIIVLINTCFACFYKCAKERKESCALCLISVLVIFMSNIILGTVADKFYNYNSEDSHKVLLIQPNYAKNQKRSLSAEQMLEGHISIAEENITPDTELVIFPETSVSGRFFTDNVYNKALYNFSQKHNTAVLFGTSYNSMSKNFNSGVLLFPDKKISEIYSKRRLVPFGEYTPAIFPQSLKFLNTPYCCSEENSLINSSIGKIGCCICFESVFPALSRDNTDMGAELLVVITNDSWIGENVPLHQHHSHSVLRAVENRKYTITCANTGISSVILPNGNIAASSHVNTVQAVSADVSANNIKTLYSETGDIIVIPSFLTLIALLIKKIAVLKNKYSKKLA